jgi:hypothetical protein
MQFLNDTITTESDAQGFMFQLVQHGICLDLDSGSATNSSGQPVFTEAQASACEQRIEEIFSVMDDPKAYLSGLTMPATDDERSNGKTTC